MNDQIQISKEVYLERNIKDEGRARRMRQARSENIDTGGCKEVKNEMNRLTRKRIRSMHESK